MKLPASIREHFVKAGRRGGLIGGKLSAARLTPAQRRARAIKAVAAREAKRKE